MHTTFQYLRKTHLKKKTKRIVRVWSTWWISPIFFFLKKGERNRGEVATIKNTWVNKEIPEHNSLLVFKVTQPNMHCCVHFFFGTLSVLASSVSTQRKWKTKTKEQKLFIYIEREININWQKKKKSKPKTKEQQHFKLLTRVTKTIVNNNHSEIESLQLCTWTHEKTKQKKTQRVYSLFCMGWKQTKKELHFQRN